MWSRYKEKYRYSFILLQELVRTDFKLRYQGSVLGYLWSFLKPIFLFIILYLVFVRFLNVGEGVPYWPVGLLIGIVLWTFFSEVTNIGLVSVVARGDVIRKINFPKYIIIFASSISALINLVLNMLVIIVFMILSGVQVGKVAILTPLFVLEIFLFGLGLAFILSSLYVRFRDVNFIWEIIMQGLFYGSVVIYPLSKIIESFPSAAKFLLLNPVAQAIQDVRHVLISDQYPTLFTLAGGWYAVIPHIIVFSILIAGMWYFKRNSPYFAENI